MPAMQESKSRQEDFEELTNMNINEFIAATRKYLFPAAAAEMSEVYAEQA